MTTKRKTFSKAFNEEAVSLLEAGKQPTEGNRGPGLTIYVKCKAWP